MTTGPKTSLLDDLRLLADAGDDRRLHEEAAIAAGAAAGEHVGARRSVARSRKPEHALLLARPR